MVYVNGHFIYGMREVKYAETYLHVNNDFNEICTQFINWPDTCDFDVTIETIDGSEIDMVEDQEYFKIYGPVKDMMLFIYKYVLKHGDCSIEDILNDTSELDIIMDVYLQKLW